MFQGSKKSVSIRSFTPDASIYVDGELKGKDAVNVLLKRKQNHYVVVKKENCQSQTVEIKRKLQWTWIAFDAAFNWWAFATDAPTGAWYTFKKKDITVELQCNKN